MSITTDLEPLDGEERPDGQSVAAPQAGVSSADAAESGAAPMDQVSLRRQEGALRTFIGLGVVWFCLTLVFLANRMSEFEVSMVALPTAQHGSQNSLLNSLDPQQIILQRFMLGVPRMTRREALRMILNYVGFTVSEDQLQAVPGEEYVSLRFENEPLYSVLHDLIANPRLGFALRGKEFSLFSQKFDQRSDPGQRELNWEADLDIVQQRTVYVPSGESDLRFVLRLAGLPEQPPNEWNIIEYEIWRGGNLVTNSRAVLNEQGGAILGLTAADTMGLQIQRAVTDSQQTPHRYRIKFNYQFFPG